MNTLSACQAMQSQNAQPGYKQNHTKYNRQLMDTLNVFPWLPLSATMSLQTALRRQLHRSMVHSAATTREIQDTGAQTIVDCHSTTLHQPDTGSIHVTSLPASPQPPPARANVPMATSPTSEGSRTPLSTQT